MTELAKEYQQLEADLQKVANRLAKIKAMEANAHSIRPQEIEASKGKVYKNNRKPAPTIARERKQQAKHITNAPVEQPVIKTNKLVAKTFKEGPSVRLDYHIQPGANDYDR